MPADKAIELFAEKLSEDLQAELRIQMARKSKTGFSGDTRLGASIRIQYLEAGDKIFGFELYMSDYWKWVNDGRGTGGVSQKGQENLIKWIKSRGIKPSVKAIKTIKNKQIRKGVKQITEDKMLKSMVFAISKKLKKEGYEPTHFFDTVINDGRIPRFTEYLKEQYKIDLELAITK